IALRKLLRTLPDFQHPDRKLRGVDIGYLAAADFDPGGNVFASICLGSQDLRCRSEHPNRKSREERQAWGGNTFTSVNHAFVLTAMSVTRAVAARLFAESYICSRTNLDTMTCARREPADRRSQRLREISGHYVSASNQKELSEIIITAPVSG